MIINYLNIDDNDQYIVVGACKIWQFLLYFNYIRSNSCDKHVLDHYIGCRYGIVRQLKLSYIITRRRHNTPSYITININGVDHILTYGKLSKIDG